VLPDERAQRHTRNQRYREPGEHDGNGARGLFLRHQARGNRRANREEHPVRQPREHAGGNQRFITRRLPRQQVAEREQRHQPEQQPLARQLARERGEHRRAYGDTQRIEADQQARRGKADAEISSDSGDEANDDELGRPDGEGAEGQREQGDWHEALLLGLAGVSWDYLCG
jgi:hypothetical protein